ncbi:permease for cytosine/purines- uracil- thiamine- allantoin-domain-containing protein [Apiospora kogelbergensis]|uniref:permease for cytosine/purines- uracil- thiamine- allantoin-domain-containing protein n=1 Tax=Apiospora kogelbergensis TaxID=1337665 RepID=UPI00312F7E8E
MVSAARRVKTTFSSREEFKKALLAPDAPAEGAAYFNEDLLPTPPERRTWTALHFFSYYLTQTFSSGSYNLGATLVSIGLQWYHGMVAAAIGSIILSAVVVLNSPRRHALPRRLPRLRARTFYGGMITAVCLRAVFGTAWERIPNALPSSAGISSKNLLAFFVYWLVQFPVMFLHPTLLRHLFVVKAVYTTVALFGVLGWAVHANGGSIGSFSYDKQVVLSGGALVWPMIQAINSVMGALCPILINQPDVARYAASFSQATWSQSTGILMSKLIVMFVSCATTSATTGILGKSYWNVWDLYDALLTEFWSPGARAGIFFAALGMVLATIATNAGSNSLPVGADGSGLLPRYLTIVRGQVLCALLAPLCVPWKIISSASTFLTFLGSYTVFLMPACGVMVVDYWALRRGNLHVPSLYTKAAGTPYAYLGGWNLRAVAAWIAGVAFTVHGIAGSLDPGAVNQASENMYKLGFLLSFFMGAGTYYVLSLVWPVPVYPADHVAADCDGDTKGFEYMARSEGFFAGENVDRIRGILVGDHGVVECDNLPARGYASSNEKDRAAVV